MLEKNNYCEHLLREFNKQWSMNYCNYSWTQIIHRGKNHTDYKSWIEQSFLKTTNPSCCTFLCIARFFARRHDQKFLQLFRKPWIHPIRSETVLKILQCFCCFPNFSSYILCWVCYWKNTQSNPNPISYLEFSAFFLADSNTQYFSNSCFFLLKNTPLFCWFITQSLPNFADQTRTPASEVSLGLSSVASACRIRRTLPCDAMRNTADTRSGVCPLVIGQTGLGTCFFGEKNFNGFEAPFPEAICNFWRCGPFTDTLMQRMLLMFNSYKVSI